MIDEVVELIVTCIGNGGKVLTFGVGGNASNAIHFAAELSGKFEQYEDPLPCIDLCSNPSVVSAIATDFGWEHVFERQIKALAKLSDVVVAFSISTKGEYLQWAFQAIKDTGCKSVLICGRYTGELDYCFSLTMSTKPTTVVELSSDDTPWVQEEQLRLIHQICRGVKERPVVEV